MIEYDLLGDSIDMICEHDLKAQALQDEIGECYGRLEELDNLLDALNNLQLDCQEWSGDTKYKDYSEFISQADTKLYFAQRKAENEVQRIKARHDTALKELLNLLKVEYDLNAEGFYEWQL